MPFLYGSLGFERFRVTGLDARHFSEEHIAQLEQAACSGFLPSSSEAVCVGFLGGEHLFDPVFALEKNVVNDALHCAIRIDTNLIPAAIRQAWMTIELAALAQQNSNGRPTKAQRLEAKQAVEARCESEAASGKYRRMTQIPVLWDLRQQTLYLGGSGANTISHCADLIERSFGVELSRLTAGSIAIDWAMRNKMLSQVEDLQPVSFAPGAIPTDFAWRNPDSQLPDFLGNEFLMWLWWTLEQVSDTIELVDGSEATVMLNKTLTLECPLGEQGKEVISAESPVKLVEAMQAIRSGKLPRKSGMSLIRHGQQVDLVLQAESFAISAAKIHLDESDDARDVDSRIDAIRSLSESVDLLFTSFCALRTSDRWPQVRQQICDWLAPTPSVIKHSAA